MIIKDMVISDKAAIDSARTKDENGYLHVAVSNITKEQIAPYMGSSIPYWQELNLDPQRVYNIYRPAVEIEKAVDTFNGLPLAYEHHDMDANNVPKEFIIGSLGTDARFESPYLKNSLTIIDAEAIKAVENGACSEISAGYMCDIVMDGGMFNGQSYDGYMTNIRGNHVAIVPQGRAGHDVKVADAADAEDAEGGVNVEKNLMAKLKELLVELLKGEEKAEEIKAENPQEMTEKVEEEIKAEALDPVKTDEEIPAEPKEEENPEAKDEETPAEPETKDEETPLEGLTEEIIEMMKNAGLDAEDKNQQKAFLAGLAVDKAKDTCKDSVDADIDRYKAMVKAADEVAPYIGKVNDPLSFKDAADIYAKALVHEGVVIDGVDPSAYSAMVSMLAKKQTQIIEAKADPINETLKSIKSM